MRGRAGDVADQLEGAEVRYVVRPSSVSELSALMAEAREAEMSVLPKGGGSKLGWLDLPPVIDVLLDLSAFDGCSYAPSTGNVTAGAAAPFAVVQDELARFGRRLELDPPSWRGTVGGMVVTGEAGPISHRFGPPAAHIVNATVVLPGGEIGEVADRVELVGNSICDLRWAFPGWPHPSCVVVETVLRTHPLPDSQAWVTFPVEQPFHVMNLLDELLAVHPSAIELDLPGMRAVAGTRYATGALSILLEGAAPGVEDRVRRFEGRGQASEYAPAWWGRYPFRPGEVAVRLTIPEGMLNVICYTLADAAGLPIPVRGSLGHGPCWAAIPADLTPQRLVAVIEAARNVLLARSGSAVVQWAPAHLRELVAPYRYP